MPRTPSSPASATARNERAGLVLGAVLRLMRPLARLLLRQGIHHRTFSVALKSVFLDAARDELKAQGMPETDSAITLLSGVHRRDVRTLLRESPGSTQGLRRPASLASEVVAQWLSDRRWRHRDGRLRVLPRGDAPTSFDSLVQGTSRDVRPRALLDELLRLGVAREVDAGVELVAESFIPRQGFAEVASLFADNLHDHLAAASENLHQPQGGPNHLEQSVFVDELTAESVARLRSVSVQAWQQAFALVMDEARQRFDGDAATAPDTARNQRARFGVYFYSAAMDNPHTEEAPS